MKAHLPRWRGLLGCVITCAIGSIGLGQTESAHEKPTVAQVIDGIARTERLFFDNASLLVRYERTKAEDVVPTSYSGGFSLAEWTMAYRGSKWFAERRFTEPKKTEKVWIPAEPLTQIIKGGALVEWTQYGRSAVIDHFDLGRNFYGGLFYTRNLSLDCPAHVAKANNADIAVIRKEYPDDADLPFLPAFLREHSDRYSVQPGAEDVDGAPCWVVEWPGMDRIWVDPQKQFAVRRRHYCWGPGKPARFEFLNRDYREVKPGLWLPFTQVEEKYASILAEKESLWGQVAARCEYRLNVAEFDNVKESQFDVKLPPGTRVVDMVRGFKYAVSGDKDSDPFTAEIEEARKRLDQPSRRAWGWLLAANIGLAVALAALWLWRRGR